MGSTTNSSWDNISTSRSLCCHSLANACLKSIKLFYNVRLLSQWVNAVSRTTSNWSLGNPACSSATVLFDWHHSINARYFNLYTFHWVFFMSTSLLCISFVLARNRPNLRGVDVMQTIVDLPIMRVNLFTVKSSTLSAAWCWLVPYFSCQMNNGPTMIRSFKKTHPNSSHYISILGQEHFRTFSSQGTRSIGLKTHWCNVKLLVLKSFTEKRLTVKSDLFGPIDKPFDVSKRLVIGKNYLMKKSEHETETMWE